eukprot:5743847-Pyramimonas_sp.AAC.3
MKGEMVLAQGHLQAHRAGGPSDFPALCAETGDAFHGFLPIALHFKGYSMVLIVFYGLGKEGFARDSSQRLLRLEAFGSLLQFPWVIVGDFNLPPAGLAQT